MGASVQKCVVSAEPSSSNHPRRHNGKSKDLADHLSTTNDFISKYGSHFSSSSYTASTTTSLSYGSHTATYSCSESDPTRTTTNSVSETKSLVHPEESQETVCTFLELHTPSHSYQHSISNTLQMTALQPQATAVTHDCLEGKCAVTGCDAVRRIIRGLQWHATMQNTNASGCDDTFD
eukprot:224666_1